VRGRGVMGGGGGRWKVVGAGEVHRLMSQGRGLSQGARGGGLAGLEYVGCRA